MATDPKTAEQINGPNGFLDDMTSSLTPEQKLWCILYRASGPHGGYCDWIPRWAWELSQPNCPNLEVLKPDFDRYIAERATSRISELETLVSNLRRDLHTALEQNRRMRAALEDLHHYCLRFEEPIGSYASSEHCVLAEHALGQL